MEETSFHDINNIGKKLEELGTHIKYMPEGEGYAEAKDHFEKSVVDLVKE